MEAAGMGLGAYEAMLFTWNDRNKGEGADVAPPSKKQVQDAFAKIPASAMGRA